MNPFSYAHLIFYKDDKNIWWRKDSLFNKCCWEKWLPVCKKLKLDPFLLRNSESTKELNITLITLKLVQERAGNTLEAISISKDYLSRTQRTHHLKEKIEKQYYIKLKSFYTTKEIVFKLKGPPTEWEKIFTSYVSHKVLITRIYRELKKVTPPKSMNQ
jgi:hypothetical protein